MKATLSCALLLCSGICFAQHTPILFHNVRVFDGQKVIAQTDVLVEHGTIRAVGPGLSADHATLVEGTGKTLLPGLIDGHVHVHGEDTLEQALLFGVTTEFDMMMSPVLKARLRQLDCNQCADFFSAGFPATVPGGHGTEYGMNVPTLTKPEAADSFVAARLREGSEYIKIMYTAGADVPRPRPTLSRETLAAVIAAAHKNHRLAVVHIGSASGARDAIEAGADGLAHLFRGDHAPGDFGQSVAEHHTFVIPTLSVLHSVCGPESAGSRLVKDPHLSPYLTSDNRRHLEEVFPGIRRWPVSCQAAGEALRQLKEAGALIVAGTDAPNPGTTYGASLHGELEMYVEEGLTPVEALITATSAAAKAFHVPDRGRIAPGLRADLLLVNGNPDENIKATRDIVAVFKKGEELRREAVHR